MNIASLPFPANFQNSILLTVPCRFSKAMSYLKYLITWENQSKHCTYKPFCSSIFTRRIVSFNDIHCAMKMGSWRHLLFLFLINLVSLTTALPQPNLPPFLGYFCNFTSSSVYQTNLNTLLSTLSNNTDKYGFHSASYGENPNTAHAIVLCRGDKDLETCRSCINTSTSKLLQVCPNSKQAIGWYDDCMLRYSNASMEGIMAGDPRIFVWNTQMVTNVAPFLQVWEELHEAHCVLKSFRSIILSFHFNKMSSIRMIEIL